MRALVGVAARFILDLANTANDARWRFGNKCALVAALPDEAGSDVPELGRKILVGEKYVHNAWMSSNSVL